LRTALSTLGVIIGVASLVAVLSLGDGMERMARAEVERTTDVQTVSVTSKTTETVDGQTLPVRDYPVFTLGDASAARDEIDRVSDVSLALGPGHCGIAADGETSVNRSNRHARGCRPVHAPPVH
jgi:putative ABC transport system permease protein